MRNSNTFNHRKYSPPIAFSKRDRRWPDGTTVTAPDWCSVDLRDGNQALIEPMTPEQKLEMFELLVAIGFKEIEVGFPSASAPDFQFVRKLIEDSLIPDDVVIQVLVPAREHLIHRTFEALQGVKRAIVHLYNSTSVVQREEVFSMSRAEVKSLAVRGAQIIREEAKKQPASQFYYQYSPESFTGTEMDFAAEICNAVLEVWHAAPDNKVIINLPATVEMTSPHVYADQVEWMSEELRPKDGVRISLHTHNDRGCGVAAAELGVLAGATRVEGTLLGNGERTGNMDIVTMAMNLYCHGIDPRLDLSNMDRIRSTVQSCTRLHVHPRHPYAGDLVFAAFSGSHQDAINKCLMKDSERREKDRECEWHVAYLPIDPRDVGRSYQEVVRVNSQSGKGGVAFILEKENNLKLPKWLQVHFSKVVQEHSETVQGEVKANELLALFEKTYFSVQNAPPIVDYELKRAKGRDEIKVRLKGRTHPLVGQGTGALAAFMHAIMKHSRCQMHLVNYEEHTLGIDEGAEAIAYVELSYRPADGAENSGTSSSQRIYGVAKSRDIIEASLKAVLNSLAGTDLKNSWL